MIKRVLQAYVLLAMSALAPATACLCAEGELTLTVRTNKERYLVYEPVLVEATVTNTSDRAISVFGWIPDWWDFQLELYTVLVPGARAGAIAQPPSDKQYLRLLPTEWRRYEPGYVELLPGQSLSALRVVFWDYHRKFGIAYNLTGKSVRVPVDLDPCVTAHPGILWLKVVLRKVVLRGGIVKKVVSKDVSVEIEPLPEIEASALQLWKDFEVARFLDGECLDQATRLEYQARLNRLAELRPASKEEAEQREQEMKSLRKHLGRDQAVRARLERLVTRYPESVYAPYARAALVHGAKWPRVLMGATLQRKG